MWGYLVFIMVLLSPAFTLGQSFHSLIANDTMHQIICKKLAKYDSILVYSQSSFWNANPMLRGLGYKGGEPYVLCIEFSMPFTIEHNRHPYFKEEKVSYKLPDIAVSSIDIIPQDSLNIVTCPQQKDTYRLSDGETITILGLYPLKGLSKYLQSYKPIFYQAYCPNEDRKSFIALLESLKKEVPMNEPCGKKKDFFTY